MRRWSKEDKKNRKSMGRKYRNQGSTQQNYPFLYHFTKSVVTLCHFHKEDVDDGILFLQHPFQQVLHHPFT
jgi:hypothetical protein